MSTFSQTASNDIEVVNGQWVLLTDNAQQVAQTLKGNLELFEGEWFADTRIGFPWFTFVLGVKNPDLRLIERLFRKACLATPGVAQVLELTVTLAPDRNLSVTLKVQTDEGAIITGGTGAPFIVIEVG